MRARLLLLLAMLAGVVATTTPAAATPPAGWAPDLASASAYADRRAGVITFHVRTERGRWSRDADRTVPSASVIKAMLLIAYLDQPGVRDRALTAADHHLLDPMVRRSDNVAATRVRDIVGAPALERLARRAGMTRFSVHPVWGLSRITARDQTRLWLRFESFVAPRHRATAMTLLQTIVPRQRWGFGRLRLPAGWVLHLKGGWGSGTGLVEHQVALLTRGEERVALAILTTGSPSHRYGKRTLRGVATRLLRGLQ